jgi:hypothetical protein
MVNDSFRRYSCEFRSTLEGQLQQSEMESIVSALLTCRSQFAESTMNDVSYFAPHPALLRDLLSPKL